MGRRVLDEGNELGHQVANEIRHAVKQINDRLHWHNTRLVERYCEHEIHLLVRFAVEGLAEQFVASFERWATAKPEADVPSQALKKAQMAGLGGVECVAHTVPTWRIEGNGEQKSMLVGHVETLEVDKQFAGTSLVRLDRIERVLYSRLREGYYYSSGAHHLVVRGAPSA